LRNLEFRLSPHFARDQKPHGWSISVGPVAEAGDFLWVVSPPYQTAPQRIIGAGYGLTAAESVQIQRQLYFVLDQSDYDRAAAIVEREPASDTKREKIARLGKGSLDLSITRYKVRTNIKTPSGAIDGLEWIEFEGRACVPRTTR